jgi:hypothetical protein
MRMEQLYLDHLRARIKELETFAQRLEQVLTKSYSEEEGFAISQEYERLGFEPDDEGATSRKPS